MTFKEQIETIIQSLKDREVAPTVVYDTEEGFDSSKTGIKYPSVSMFIADADRFNVTVDILVVDRLKADLSNRLEVQSEMLDKANLVAAYLIVMKVIKDDNYTLEPTNIIGRDTVEGFRLSLPIRINQEINCL